MAPAIKQYFQITHHWVIRCKQIPGCWKGEGALLELTGAYNER